jgi:hypothetical protein
VDRTVDPDLASSAEVRAVENGRAGGDKDFIADFGPDHMAIGPYHTVIPNCARMLGRSPNNCVFQDDAVATNFDRSAGLSNKPCPMHNPTARTYEDIPADGSILCNPSVGINRRRMA